MFIIKPMLGKISPNSFKIFCIQFFTTCTGNYQEYFEEWSLNLNGQIQESKCLTLKAILEKPVILINDSSSSTDRVVNFGPVYFGHVAKNQFKVTNITHHRLSYKLFQLRNFASMERVALSK